MATQASKLNLGLLAQDVLEIETAELLADRDSQLIVNQTDDETS